MRFNTLVLLCGLAVEVSLVSMAQEEFYNPWRELVIYPLFMGAVGLLRRLAKARGYTITLMGWLGTWTLLVALLWLLPAHFFLWGVSKEVYYHVFATMCPICTLLLFPFGDYPLLSILALGFFILELLAFFQLPSGPNSPDQMIFGIGLSRTGTSSLTAALLHLGFDIAHYPVIISEHVVLPYLNGLTDLPAFGCGNLERFAERYPDALFIHTRRDREDWARAVHKFVYNRRAELQLWMMVRHYTNVYPNWLENGVGASEDDESVNDYWRDIYDGHMARVEKLKSKYPNIHILDMDITRGAGWKELCVGLREVGHGHLCKEEIEDTPFPLVSEVYFHGPHRLLVSFERVLQWPVHWISRLTKHALLARNETRNDQEL